MQYLTSCLGRCCQPCPIPRWLYWKVKQTNNNKKKLQILRIYFFPLFKHFQGVAAPHMLFWGVVLWSGLRGGPCAAKMHLCRLTFSECYDSGRQTGCLDHQIQSHLLYCMSEARMERCFLLSITDLLPKAERWIGGVQGWPVPCIVINSLIVQLYLATFNHRIAFNFQYL